MIRPIAVVTSLVMVFSALNIKAAAPMDYHDYAAICELSEEEFILFSSVVEAESDRSVPSEGLTTEGRIYIALTIWNRLEDHDRWHCETVTEVLTAPGQFSTVRTGASVTNRTEWSDRAVYEAYAWRYGKGSDAPDVQFFNCRGYFSGREPVAYVGGNYFSR